MIYTAKLHRVFRDVATGTPKTLLTQVRDMQGNLYRGDGHCHVMLSEVEQYLPKEGKYCLLKFSAEEVKYYKQGQLANTLGSIKLVNKPKYYYNKPKCKKQYKKDGVKTFMALFDKI